MRTKAGLAAVLLLSACAAQNACKPQVKEETKVVTEYETRYVVVRAPRANHKILLSDYAGILNQERVVTIHAKNPSQVDKLIPLDQNARIAMYPIEDPDHVATQTEIKRAILAISALQIYVNTLKGAEQ